MSEELIYLTRCCRLIEAKWQRGESKFWKNGDYQKLSELVSTSSRISISPDTLKRLFGKTKTYRSYNPQIETKNALAIFIGYEGWEDFKKRQPVLVGEERLPAPAAPPESGLAPPPEPAPATWVPDAAPVAPDAPPAAAPPAPADILPPEVPPAYSAPPPAASPRRGNRWVGWAVLGLVLLAGLGWLSAPRAARRDAGVAAGPVGNKPLFRARSTRDTVPYTVVFEYDIARLPADSVYIDYGYGLFGHHERELLPRYKRLITYYYHFPGRYTVRLWSGRQVLDSIPVEVLSRGWMAAVYLKNNRLESLEPKLLREGRRKGRLYVSPEAVRAAGIDTALVNWTEFSNIRTFGVDGDNFSLETRFRNSPAEGGFACLESMLRVLGERNLFRLQFNQPGCAHWATVQFGEIELAGKFNDLSPFSTAVSGWRVARLEVRGRRARVLLDGKPVYQMAYRQPVGALRGIIYNFRGGGAVDYIRLFNAKNALVYADEFDR
ncbi:MAG: hypothetical protein AVDCRST_MAG56-615 [uncultured Cytophagales bacterium]|uniref:Uncharacterized protein n=1 Tax=uncultured Cytophagales bacterium TaxID=158755 RepID=A0A6J4HH36_9SPHI|nr:MAG: hypothetical protein AVDCRST_MAG56-615 [uncultured Cytophagales bacterium]